MAITIKKVEYLTSAVNKKGWPPEGPPEIAFAGRSNVGKSSLLNAMLNRRKLARVSSKPGRTQMINFFAINGDAFRFVDLPGYGFAKVPKKVKAGWQQMIESFLTARSSLAGVVVILDIRREPSDEDIMLLDFFRSYNIPAVVAATKVDKLSNNQKAQRLAKLRPVLREFDPHFTPFSALKKTGRSELWERLEDLMAAHQPDWGPA